MVVHEWWGCNDYARSRAKRLAELGYVAFACDMYGKGVTTTDPAQAREAGGRDPEGPEGSANVPRRGSRCSPISRGGCDETRSDRVLLRRDHRAATGVQRRRPEGGGEFPRRSLQADAGGCQGDQVQGADLQRRRRTRSPMRATARRCARRSRPRKWTTCSSITRARCTPSPIRTRARRG